MSTAPLASGSSVAVRLSSRTKTTLVAGVGIGVFVLGWFLRRWLRSSSDESQKPNVRLEGYSTSGALDVDMLHRQERPESGRGSASRLRCTPSFSERGSTRQSSTRQRTQFSTSVPPVEADIMFGTESCQDLIRMMERALSGLEMVRNRSEKDRTRADMLSSVIDRLRVLETDLSRLVSEGGFEDIKEEVGGAVSYQSPPRAGTLSVLSDDSFMSAFEEFPISLDEDGRNVLELPMSELKFYQAGLEAACNGEVLYRKARTDFVQCESEMEFAAKLWCLRQAFEEVLRDEHRRVWLSNAGRTLLADILKHSRQDPAPFYAAFDNLMEFFGDEENIEQMEEELSARKVANFGFWDIVIDFILLDAFDDMKNPPSAIYSVTKNYFLSYSMKYSTISTVIWSMLKAKRQRLKDPNGFIAHFYNISEAVSPAITLGFLGTDERIGELCQYFKEQITQFALDVFSHKRVRYTSLKDLAEDVWVVLQSRTEAVQTRLSTELMPA